MSGTNEGSEVAARERSELERLPVLFINAKRERSSREVVGAGRRLQAIPKESPSPKERKRSFEDFAEGAAQPHPQRKSLV